MICYRKTSALLSQNFKLAFMLDDRYLCEKDERFVAIVSSDLQEFIDKHYQATNIVFLFPPVNNYLRLLIHKTVESEFPFLHSFSVGEGESRRTVICWKSALKNTRDSYFDSPCSDNGVSAMRGRGRARNSGSPSPGAQAAVNSSDRWGHDKFQEVNKPDSWRSGNTNNDGLSYQPRRTEHSPGYYGNVHDTRENDAGYRGNSHDTRTSDADYYGNSHDTRASDADYYDNTHDTRASQAGYYGTAHDTRASDVGYYTNTHDNRTDDFGYHASRTKKSDYRSNTPDSEGNMASKVRAGISPGAEGSTPNRTRKERPKNRRPDVQVYVPRGRRQQHGAPANKPSPGRSIDTHENTTPISSSTVNVDRGSPHSIDRSGHMTLDRDTPSSTERSRHVTPVTYTEHPDQSPADVSWSQAHMPGETTLETGSSAAVRKKKKEMPHYVPRARLQEQMQNEVVDDIPQTTQTQDNTGRCSVKSALSSQRNKTSHESGRPELKHTDSDKSVASSNFEIQSDLFMTESNIVNDQEMLKCDKSSSDEHNAMLDCEDKELETNSVENVTTDHKENMMAHDSNERMTADDIQNMVTFENENMKSETENTTPDDTENMMTGDTVEQLTKGDVESLTKSDIEQLTKGEIENLTKVDIENMTTHDIQKLTKGDSENLMEGDMATADMENMTDGISKDMTDGISKNMTDGISKNMIKGDVENMVTDNIENMVSADNYNVTADDIVDHHERLSQLADQVSETVSCDKTRIKIDETLTEGRHKHIKDEVESTASLENSEIGPEGYGNGEVPDLNIARNIEVLDETEHINSSVRLDVSLDLVPDSKLMTDNDDLTLSTVGTEKLDQSENVESRLPDNDTVDNDTVGNDCNLEIDSEISINVKTGEEASVTDEEGKRPSITCMSIDDTIVPVLKENVEIVDTFSEDDNKQTKECGNVKENVEIIDTFTEDDNKHTEEKCNVKKYTESIDISSGEFDRHKKESGKMKSKSKKMKKVKMKASKHSTNDAKLETMSTDNDQSHLIVDAVTNQSDLGKLSSKNTDQSVDGNGTHSQSEEMEEDSWDAMFDEDGECLDPSAMEELTQTVGKVKIEKATTINYLDYQPKDKADMDFAQYNHIIEIYDFPTEFVTRDIIMAFQAFMSRGFDLKWVDDTHALGIFSSAIAAKDALNTVHPLLKVCPLELASRQSKQKARRCTEFLQPYKARPETTASAARRLVAGALGLATNVPKEKRDMERQQLKEAKAKRRQDRQNRDQIWEYGKCAMDEQS